MPISMSVEPDTQAENLSELTAFDVADVLLERTRKSRSPSHSPSHASATASSEASTVRGTVARISEFDLGRTTSQSIGEGSPVLT